LDAAALRQSQQGLETRAATFLSELPDMTSTEQDLSAARQVFADLRAVNPENPDGPFAIRAAVLAYQSADTKVKDAVLQAMVVLLGHATPGEQQFCVEFGRDLKLPGHIVSRMAETYEKTSSVAIARLFAESHALSVAEGVREKLHTLFVSAPDQHPGLALVALRHRNDAATWQAFCAMLASTDDLQHLKWAFDAANASQHQSDFYDLIVQKSGKTIEALLQRLPNFAREQIRKRRP
jgi:hypothetical protein